MPARASSRDLLALHGVRLLGSGIRAHLRWDDRVVHTLGSVGRGLKPRCSDLSAMLTRFDGYAGRYAAALDRVERGERRWVDGLDIDSCHVVWMQLHEDLLATLGIPRGEES